MTARREDGFTLIELLVATAILAVGVLALLGSLDSSRAETSSAEAEVVASTIGQRELERVSAQPYARIALAASPGTAADPADPRFYVTTTVTAACPSSTTPAAPPCYQWDQAAAASTADTEPLVVDAANADTTANPQAWSAPAPNGGTRLAGSVYRFVTWARDPSCTGAGCNQTTGYKRVTVAVTVDSSPLRHPIVLSTLVANTAGGVNNPLTDVGTSCQDGGSSVACAN